METIRIFIGTEPAQWLPTEVLKWSVLRRTRSPVEFRELRDLKLGIESRMYTGFSFYRFYIPEACGYQGRAIYLDADIVVLADIAELYRIEMGEKGVLSRPGAPGTWLTSVMLMDCAKLKHWKVRDWVTMIENQLIDYGETMYGGAGGPNHADFGDLPSYWNHLDQADATTKIIHYTEVPTQPWKTAGHPHADIFLKEMKSAMQEGRVSADRLKAEIDAGHVYPSLLDDALQ